MAKRANCEAQGQQNNVHLYQVINVQLLTEHVSQIFLQPSHSVKLVYVAGQYIEVIHEHHAPSPLSIACIPNPAGILEFHLFHPHENRRAHDLLQMAQEDKRWHLSGPFGHSTVAQLQKNKPIIFLASGTGFAPIKAVIEALIASESCPMMQLYWSLRTPKESYLTPLIEQWQLPFTPVYTKKMGIDAAPQAILSDHPDLSSYQIYASGPRPLIHTALSLFLQHGLKREWFYSDMAS